MSSVRPGLVPIVLAVAEDCVESVFGEVFVCGFAVTNSTEVVEDCTVIDCFAFDIQ